MAQKQCLVTGATGHTGGYTVEQLLERGHAVRALAHREDDRSIRLEKMGAEVVIGDLLKFNDVRAAMRGVRGAYFCYPIRPGILQATACFAQAAKEAGLECVVNMSQRSPVVSSVRKLRISRRVSIPSQSRLAKPAMFFLKSTAEQSQSNCKKEFSLERIRLLRRSAVVHR